MVQQKYLVLAALALGACGLQKPVEVVNKGSMYFGRDGSRDTGYRSADSGGDWTPQVPGYRYVPEPTSQEASAKVQTVEIAELSTIKQIEIAPLTPPKPAPASKIEAAPPVALAPLAALPVIAPEEREESIAVIPKKEAPIAEAKAEQIAQPVSHFIWPVQGKIISAFGPKQNGRVNDGVNISAPKGEPIHAAADGEVVYAGNELGGYGNMVILRHAGDWMTAYAHAQEIVVTKGARLHQGDLLGYVGDSGSVSTSQLHFGIRQGKKPLDPESLLPRRLAAR